MSNAQMEAAPFRDGPTGALTLPLQSDAPWIHRGIAAVTVGCVALFVPLFLHGHHPAALGVIPALATAVFAGSGLAAWGRTRGGTATLEVSAGRVEIREHDHRRALLERGLPWSVALLVDPRPGRRMLVIGQRADTFIVLEPSPVPGDAQPSDRGWQSRTTKGDLDALAVSPASAGVLTLATGTSLTPLLDILGHDLEPSTPRLQHQLAGGETLRVTSTELSLGNRRLPLGSDTRVMAYTLDVGRGTPLAALGVVHGDDAESTVLLACEDSGLLPGAVPSNIEPDAFVPIHVFEALRALLG